MTASGSCWKKMEKAADPTIRFLCARPMVPQRFDWAAAWGWIFLRTAKWVASTGVKQPGPTVLLPTGAGQPLTLADGQLFHSARLNFLPDGKGVIMVAAEPGKSPRTYIQMLDGTPPKAFGPEQFRGSQISPDGKNVLGRKDEAPWILPMSGTEPGQALPSMKPDELITGWTADSRSIYVSDVSSMPAKAYVMDLKTGQRKLHHEIAPADPSGVPQVSRRPGHAGWKVLHLRRAAHALLPVRGGRIEVGHYRQDGATAWTQALQA